LDFPKDAPLLMVSTGGSVTPAGISDVSHMSVLNNGQQGLVAFTVSGAFYIITATMEPFVAAVHVANLDALDDVRSLVRANTQMDKPFFP
jgi:hypothetical protein